MPFARHPFLVTSFNRMGLWIEQEFGVARVEFAPTRICGLPAHRRCYDAPRIKADLSPLPSRGLLGGQLDLGGDEFAAEGPGEYRQADPAGAGGAGRCSYRVPVTGNSVASKEDLAILPDVDLGELIKQHGPELKDVSSGLTEGKREKIVAALGTLVLGLVTQNPAVGLLTPFIEAGARRAFALSGTRRLEAAIAAANTEQEKAALVAQIAESIEALLGQSLIQMVRVQHQTKDEVIEALGGVRKELADFREEFQERMEDEGVRVDVQRIRDGARGIRISEGARARIWVGEMTVSGAGSIGIDVRKR
jgi:hypothetical protein